MMSLVPRVKFFDTNDIIPPMPSPIADKNKKEVDFVLLHEEKYFPFEVKYQAQINSPDFFGFKSFNKGVLITKDELGIYRNYAKIPISIFLLLI